MLTFISNLLSRSKRDHPRGAEPSVILKPEEVYVIVSKEVLQPQAPEGVHIGGPVGIKVPGEHEYSPPTVMWPTRDLAEAYRDMVFGKRAMDGDVCMKLSELIAACPKVLKTMNTKVGFFIQNEETATAVAQGQITDYEQYIHPLDVSCTGGGEMEVERSDWK